MKNKHGNHPVAASNPHPNVHPYLNNASQEPYPQRTPEMIANNTYYAEGTRAPTVMSLGPNGPWGSYNCFCPTPNRGSTTR